MLSFLKSGLRKLFALAGQEITPLARFGANPIIDAAKIIRSNKGSFCILDVGANIGQMAVSFLNYFPGATVHSFEPNPAAYQELSDLAKLYAGRLKTYSFALSDHEGKAELHLNPRSVTNSLLVGSSSAERHLPEGDLTPTGKASVGLHTLDNWTVSNDIGYIDLLKIDTQGYDLQVLRGAQNLLSSGKVLTVLCEVNFVSLYENQAWFHEIYEFMWARSYKLVGLYAPHPTSGGYTAWADALFVHEIDKD